MIEISKMKMTDIRDARRLAGVLARRSGVDMDNDAEIVLAELILHLRRTGDLTENRLEAVFDGHGDPIPPAMPEIASSAILDGHSPFLEYLFAGLDPVTVFSGPDIPERIVGSFSAAALAMDGIFAKIRRQDELDREDSLAMAGDLVPMGIVPALRQSTVPAVWEEPLRKAS